MKVSICIPVYNVENLIGRCLDSVINQSYNNLEIIIVNDCTPDNSMQIVNQYAQKDHRIKIINHDKNHGLMMTRKTGYMAATGDYITFCDSDDYLPKDSIEILYNEAIKTDADVVSGDYMYITVNGCQIINHNKLNYGNDKLSVYKSLLRRELNHTVWGKLYRSSVLKNYKYNTYENFTNGEDGCLFYQLVENVNRVIQINKPVYYYMQNTQSSTQVRLGDKAIKSICIVNKTKVDMISDYPDLKPDLQKCITNVLYSLYSQGYGYSTRLDDYIVENGLEGYKKLSFKYLDATELFKFWIKRYIQGPIWYIKALK